jgi:hypothetical protein
MNDEMQGMQGMQETQGMQEQSGPQPGADWRAGLPPDLQHAVKNHNDLEGFVRAFVDTKNFVGKKFEGYYSAMPINGRNLGTAQR